MIDEAYLKIFSQRNKEPLDIAEQASNKSKEILERILGDKPNYLIAKALLSIGDIQMQRKNLQEAENVILRA